MLLAGSAFMLLAWLFSRIYLRPIARLARTAEQIAAGQEAYPVEVRVPAEAQRISAALVRLEAQRD